MAIRQSSEDTATATTPGPHGSGSGAEECGPSRDPSWSAPAPSGAHTRALQSPFQPTATRPSSEVQTTMVALGQLGSGPEAEEFGRSRDPSWSVPAPWGAPFKVVPYPSPRTATRPSLGGMATMTIVGHRGSGRGQQESGLNKDPS